MVAVTLQARIATATRTGSLLYTLISNEEVIEGPLDARAYAQSSDEAAGDGSVAASDFDISFTDPEVDFSAVIGGNAVVAPLNPLGSVEPQRPATADDDSKQPSIYTVEAGDTVAGIAEKFTISADTILSANGLTQNEVIKTGDHLTILPVSGVLHQVRSGDTVSAIANKYDVKASEIVAYNNLGDEAKLAIGDKVMVPGGRMPAPQHSAHSDASPSTPDDTTPAPAPETSAGSWQWPTTTRHISQGFRWGHTGIDIDNRARPAIYAARAGTVDFSGWLGGYGRLIIINHGGGLQTYYAHLDKAYVSAGEAVSQGQAIAKMGSTGRSTGPHLHFEVRRSGRPVNPMGQY